MVEGPLSIGTDEDHRLSVRPRSGIVSCIQDTPRVSQRGWTAVRPALVVLVVEANPMPSPGDAFEAGANACGADQELAALSVCHAGSRICWHALRQQAGTCCAIVAAGRDEAASVIVDRAAAAAAATTIDKRRGSGLLADARPTRRQLRTVFGSVAPLPVSVHEQRRLGRPVTVVQDIDRIRGQVAPPIGQRGGTAVRPLPARRAGPFEAQPRVCVAIQVHCVSQPSALGRRVRHGEIRAKDLALCLLGVVVRCRACLPLVAMPVVVCPACRAGTLLTDARPA